ASAPLSGAGTPVKMNAIYDRAAGKLCLFGGTDQDTGAGKDHAADVALMVPAAGGGTQVGKILAAALGSGDALIPVAVVRKDTPADLAGAVDKATVLEVGPSGELWVTLAALLADNAALPEGTSKGLPAGVDDV